MSAKTELVEKGLKLLQVTKQADVKDAGSLANFSCAEASLAALSEEKLPEHKAKVFTKWKMDVFDKAAEPILQRGVAIKQKALRVAEEALKASISTSTPVAKGKPDGASWRDDAKSQAFSALVAAAKPSIGKAGVVKSLKEGLTTLTQDCMLQFFQIT